MFELPSKADIEKISMEVLRGSKALDVYPTPVDRILKFSELQLEKGIDLSKVEQTFFSKISEKVLSGFKAIRGYLDRQEKTIYLDLSQLPSRQNFVKLHETGHDVLYWQRQIMECIDDDATLSPEIEEEFEAEANYFASITLFQQDRFEYQMNKLELSIKAPMHLAKLFGGSNHAALRKYVECSKDKCALLVLEKCLEAPFTLCLNRNFFSSLAFDNAYGAIELPEYFDRKWAFAQDFFSPRRYHEAGSISLNTQNGEVDFTYHFFNNKYNSFVFLFPIGEHRKSRTKIIASI